MRDTYDYVMDFLHRDVVKKAVFTAFLACVFFFCLRYGHGIIDGPKFYIFFAVFALFFLANTKVRIDLIDMPTMILVLAYFLMGIYEHMFWEGQADTYNYIPYTWLVPTTYILGKLCVGDDKSRLGRRVFAILSTMATGMYIQGLLNYYAYYKYSEYVDYQHPGGIWRSFWDAAVDGTRNNWNNGFLVVLASLVFAFTLRKKNKKFFIASVFAIVFCMLLNIKFSGRTVPAIFVVITFIMTVLYLVINCRLISKKHWTIIASVAVACVAAVGIVYIMYLKNIAGVGDFFSAYYFTRDGGVIKNVRLDMWKWGIIYAFTLQKGGWVQSDVSGLATSHNTWIEFARYYDIIVFLLMVMFVVMTLVGGIRILAKHGTAYKVLFWAEAVELIMFIYAMEEPAYIQNRDLLLFFYFICGMVGGIGRTAESGDYFVLGESVRPNRWRRFVIGMGLLFMALIACAYIDWYNDRLDMMWGFLIPVVAYLVGGIICTGKYRLHCLLVGAGCSGLYAICMYFISSKSQYFQFDLYTEPFSDVVVEKSVYVAMWILPLAVVIGLIFYKLQLNKVIAAIVITVVALVGAYPYISDGRLVFIKEAFRLQMGMKSGLQWIASKDNHMLIRTSHSMWLDYARDYGMVVFGILIAFEIWTIICFVRMLLKNDKSLFDYILMVAFILYNYQYMFEASAITSKYILAMGLCIYGCLSSPGRGWLFSSINFSDE